MVKVSDSELIVLNVVWTKEEVTSAGIINELSEKKWNKNTIRTLLIRLVHKKVVGISKKEGKVYTYVPLIKKQTYQKEMTKRFIDMLYDGSNSELIKFLNDNMEEKWKEIED